MDLKHIRYFGVLRVREYEDTTTVLFSRSFLSDQFNRYRRVQKNTIVKTPTQIPEGFVPSINPQKFESLKNTLPAASRSSKYFSSVGYTLSVLAGKLDTSDSDASSDEDLSEKQRNATTHKFRMEKVENDKTDVKPVMEQTTCDDDLDLVDKLRRLGLPTSFGPTGRILPVVDYNLRSTHLPIIRIDEKLLRFAQSDHSSVRPTRRIRSTSRNSRHALHHPLKLWTSSSDLHGYQRATFRTFCRLIELSCSFKKYPLPRLRLDLASAWQKPDFNLNAFLHTCKRYWQYKEPMGPTTYDSSPSITFSTEHLSSDPTLAKYWAQRFRLFSLFNHGIQMDRDGIFSATPEAIAAHQARRIFHTLSKQSPVASVDNLTVIDVFSGLGSNSIQFARVGFRVIAIDSDPCRLAMSAHNAKIYGVDSRIEFVCQDFFDWALNQISKRSAPYSALFMSPPWGGPDYINQPTFDLSSIPLDTSDSYNDFWHAVRLASILADGNLALFLPRNTNVVQIVRLAQCVSTANWLSPSNANYGGGLAELEVNVLNSKPKAISVYTGLLANAQAAGIERAFPIRIPTRSSSDEFFSDCSTDHVNSQSTTSDSCNYLTLSESSW